MPNEASPTPSTANEASMSRRIAVCALARSIVTSADDTSLIGIEIRGGNTIDDRSWLLARQRKIATFDNVFADIAPNKERREGRDADRSYSRQSLKAFQGQAMKGIDLVGVGVTRRGKHNRSSNEAFGLPSAARVT